MLGLIVCGVLGLGVVCNMVSAEERGKYLTQLENDKAGKTIARTSTENAEIFTFSSKQSAIEHPQEITFDPNEYACSNKETVFLLNCHKKSIEIYTGKEFVSISDTDLVEITSDEGTTYAYLKFKEKEIRR